MIVGIDPGHGGKDPGAVAGDLTEANYVWQFSQRLETTLKLNNHSVLKSRQKDEDPPFSKRTENLAGSNVCFSIHINAGQPSWTGGIFFWTAGVVASDKSSFLAKKLHEHWPNEFRHRRTASALHSVAAEDLDSQLWLKRPYNVIRRYSQPAVLAELFFLSNAFDRKFAEHPFIEEQMRWAFVRALDAYQGQF